MPSMLVRRVTVYSIGYSSEYKTLKYYIPVLFMRRSSRIDIYNVYHEYWTTIRLKCVLLNYFFAHLSELLCVFALPNSKVLFASNSFSVAAVLNV